MCALPQPSLYLISQPAFPAPPFKVRPILDIISNMADATTAAGTISPGLARFWPVLQFPLFAQMCARMLDFRTNFQYNVPHSFATGADRQGDPLSGGGPLWTFLALRGTLTIAYHLAVLCTSSSAPRPVKGGIGVCTGLPSVGQRGRYCSGEKLSHQLQFNYAYWSSRARGRSPHPGSSSTIMTDSRHARQLHRDCIPPPQLLHTPVISWS
jgi:hypothetical protein